MKIFLQIAILVVLVYVAVLLTKTYQATVKNAKKQKSEEKQTIIVSPISETAQFTDKIVRNGGETLSEIFGGSGMRVGV